MAEPADTKLSKKQLKEQWKDIQRAKQSEEVTEAAQPKQPRKLKKSKKVAKKVQFQV